MNKNQINNGMAQAAFNHMHVRLNSIFKSLSPVLKNIGVEA
jgi:hypothetical protein